jgi:hypothetical protein
VRRPGQERLATGPPPVVRDRAQLDLAEKPRRSRCLGLGLICQTGKRISKHDTWLKPSKTIGPRRLHFSAVGSCIYGENQAHARAFLGYLPDAWGRHRLFPTRTGRRSSRRSNRFVAMQWRTSTPKSSSVSADSSIASFLAAPLLFLAGPPSLAVSRVVPNRQCERFLYCYSSCPSA